MANFGERTFDLSTARDEPEQVSLRGVRYVAVVDADDEVYLQFNDGGVKYDARKYNAFPFPSGPPAGVMWVSNPSGTGTLRLLLTDGEVTPSPATKIREISEVTGSIDADLIGQSGADPLNTNVSDRTGRDLGKARLMDSAGTLIAGSNPLPTARPNLSGLTSGRQTVAASGTAEELNGGTTLSVPDGIGVKIMAPTDNTGSVYVGDSTVGVADGYELEPGDEMPTPIYVDDVSTIFVDADNAGDAVTWVVEG